MKQMICCAIALVLLLKATAQQNKLDSTILLAEKSKTYIGFRAGYISATLQGKDVPLLSTGGAPSSLNGFLVGVVVHTKLIGLFSLRSELTILRAGTVLRLIDSSSGQAYKSRFNSLYLTLQPVTPTICINKLQIYAGPYVSALINAAIQRKGSDGKMYTDKTIFGEGASAGGYRSKLDAGIVAGAEYEFKKGFCIGICYRRGFIPVIENTSAQQQWHIFNQHIALSMGFNLK